MISLMAAGRRIYHSVNSIIGQGYQVDVEPLLRKLKRGRLEKGSEAYKIMAEVFDSSTLLTLYRLINRGLFDELYGAVSTGKEANIFFARDREGNPRAVKIYRIATSNFRTMWRYLGGDPRFKRFRRSRRHIIYTWVTREFKNLQRAYKARVAVPEPLDAKKNVLVMEFVGEKGAPYPRMKDSPPGEPRAMFEELFGFVKVLYNKAELVHSDLSEYNVLVTPEPVLIDFSMATDVANPMADEWLRRDIQNLASYFHKLGVHTPEPEQMFQEVKGE